MTVCIDIFMLPGNRRCSAVCSVNTTETASAFHRGSTQGLGVMFPTSLSTYGAEEVTEFLRSP